MSTPQLFPLTKTRLPGYLQTMKAEIQHFNRGPKVEELDRTLAAAIEKRLHAEYQRGKKDGLRIAKVIRGWLTRQPDRAWQKQVREWADKEIDIAENLKP